MTNLELIEPRGESYRPRVLLVDDQTSIRGLLYTLLERAGYEVLAASSAAEGLSIFQHSIRPIELLVTDYNMAGMSGLELADECCRLSRDLGVLYVSGADPDTRLQADLRTQRREFLAKPFHSSDLLRKTRALLSESFTHMSASA